MASTPDEATVRGWIDRTLVERVQSANDPNAEYNLIVNQSGWDIHLIKPNDNDLVRVIGRANFDPETLALIFDSERMVRDLRTQLAAVLTGSSSIYSYRDGNDNPCDFESMRAIQFEDRIYPDGASQDRLMNAIMSIVKALSYLSTTVGAYREDLDTNR